MKRVLSFILVLSLLFCLAACGSTVTPDTTEVPTAVPTASPTAAPTEAPTAEPTEEPTPDPLAAYDPGDLALLREFFEQKDGDGVTNGEKLFAAYDPEDPATWYDDRTLYPNAVHWNEEGRVVSLSFTGTGESAERLVGVLDISGLDGLTQLLMYNSAVDVFKALSPIPFGSQNSAVIRAVAEGEAEVRGGYVEKLFVLSAEHVLVDITGEAESYMTDLPTYKIEITVEGAGYAGVSAFGDEVYYEVHLKAEPKEGSTFIGWFDADGNLVSTEEYFELFGENTAGPDEINIHGEFAFTARFE